MSPGHTIAPAVVAIVLITGAAGAQTQAESGRLEGRVLDEARGALPGVKVSARSVASGQEHAAVTNVDGIYLFEALTPGLYDITVESSGFVTEVRHGVAVPGEGRLEIAMRLLTLEELMKIQVKSASKLDERPLEAPGVVSVVTTEEVERYGWVSLNDVLYKQPGFGPAQDYDRHTVSSRGVFEGWNNNHLLHLVDGIPFNDNLYGTAYTWEVTPLFMCKTIEVLRGPISALYGSNAMNGVVQVNTLSASDLEGRAEATVRLGNDGVRIYDALAGFGAGNRVSGVLGYNSYETDGYEHPSYDGSGRRDAMNNLEQFVTNDRRSSRYFWAKLEGGKELGGLALQYHEQSWKFQTGHGWLWWIPDFREAMEETRRIVALSYRSIGTRKVSQDHVVRYQKHGIDWNTRYYPNGAFRGAFPAGAWEYLNTAAEDVFLRSQLSLKLAGKSTALLGLEGDRFSYRGDAEHNSNVDVDAEPPSPFLPDSRTSRLGPWLDYIAHQPLTNVGVYGQYSAPGRLGGHLNLTLGARYDRLSFKYRDIRLPGPPLVDKSYSRVSPRAAVVVLPSEKLSIKLLAARAFRAPSPTELAGAHTMSLASNIDQLEPEVMTTFELAASWALSESLNLRGSVYRSEFEKQIAYSAANLNLSTNIYTLTTAGAEAEALLTHGGVSAFLNYSHARRLDEKIIDRTIAASTDRLTWDPAHKVNFGLAVSRHAWSVALSGHYQGAVERRVSDVGLQTLPLNVVSLDLDRFRSRSLPAWFTLDGKASYRLPGNLVVALVATNLTDNRDHRLVKTLAFPFDYQQEGRRYHVSLGAKF